MSDFIQRSEVLLGEISKEFESLGLTQLYLDYYKDGNMEYDVYEKMVNGFDNVIKSLADNEDKLEELNYMNKMLSDKNCWYIDYRVGELLHKRLMNHWHGVEITEE